MNLICWTILNIDSFKPFLIAYQKKRLLSYEFKFTIIKNIALPDLPLYL